MWFLMYHLVLVVGLPSCLSLWLLALFFPFFLRLRGRSNQHQKCSHKWKGKCEKCGKAHMWLHGIFCPHFYWSMDAFNPCQHMMWCGACYTMSKEVHFPIKEQAIETEKNENKPREWQGMIAAWGERHRLGNQYESDRGGDHALVPFECDFCVFRKLR
jgi:hypothetical protein